jgi:hypothetical protein
VAVAQSKRLGFGISTGSCLSDGPPEPWRCCLSGCDTAGGFLTALHQDALQRGVRIETAPVEERLVVPEVVLQEDQDPPRVVVVDEISTEEVAFIGGQQLVGSGGHLAATEPPVLLVSDGEGRSCKEREYLICVTPRRSTGIMGVIHRGRRLVPSLSWEGNQCERAADVNSWRTWVEAC